MKSRHGQNLSETYETCAIWAEATNELFPRCASIGQYDDSPDEFPGILNLLFPDTTGLVSAKTGTIDILQGFFGIHLDKLSYVTPYES